MVASPSKRQGLDLKTLVGSGDRIALLTLPFAVAGVALNIADPSLFRVGGPPPVIRIGSAIALAVGLAGWLWSVALILSKVPRGQLITGGPFSVVAHPLYTSVALLVLPSAGFLLNTWVGAAIGIAMYVATRIFAPAEEAVLAKTFDGAWLDYRASVKIPWL